MTSKGPMAGPRKGVLNQLQEDAQQPWTPAAIHCPVSPDGWWLVAVDGSIVASGEHEDDIEDDFWEVLT